jgi:hypothetical protein
MEKEKRYRKIGHGDFLTTQRKTLWTGHGPDTRPFSQAEVSCISQDFHPHSVGLHFEKLAALDDPEAFSAPGILLCRQQRTWRAAFCVA